jgi:hypothetical protein
MHPPNFHKFTAKEDYSYQFGPIRNFVVHCQRFFSIFAGRKSVTHYDEDSCNYRVTPMEFSAASTIGRQSLAKTKHGGEQSARWGASAAPQASR